MRYQFGDCIIDLERHELFRAGMQAQIRPKVFQLLSYLLENNDRMVPKAELLEAIWPTVVGDDALNSCVMAARRAVGDDGRTQAIIKTTHGLGYRFVATLDEHPIQSEESDIAGIDESSISHGDPALEVKPSVSGHERTDIEASISVQPTNEFKTVTALACSVDLAKTLAEEIGPEAMHACMQLFFAHARTVINRHEGSMVQWLDDGFLALFGAPVAHDDDARRGVIAAFELSEILASTSFASKGSSIELQLSVSMGLHTGPVMVGSLVADDDSRPYTAPGKTTNLAVELLSVAEPGTILISQNTHDLVEAEVGAEPMTSNFGATAFRVHEIVKRRAGVPRRNPQHSGQFVGRREELAILRERLKRTEKADGQIIGISGAAGIGKSRLVKEFTSSLDCDEVRVLRGQCLAYGKRTPYLPVSDLIQQLFAIADIRDEGHVRKKIKAGLDGKTTSPHAEILLYQLLGLPVEQDILRELSPQARRSQTFSLLLDLIFAAAADRPIVAVIEDLHWIDATSDAWLETFATRLDQTALLLIVTYRPSSSPNWIGTLSATQLALPPLTRNDSTALAKSILSDGGADLGLTDGLVAKAGGNPFFLEELSYALAASPTPAEPASLPDTVQAVLTSRIDRLDAACKHTLQICSVIGVMVPLGLLRKVVNLDEQAIDRCMVTLEEAGFMLGTHAASEEVYLFKHALTQEATYKSLPASARATLHAQTAEALEQHFDHVVTNQPEVLARHHAGANNSSAAIENWQRASRIAYQRSANIEAINYAKEGLDLLANSGIKAGRSARELSLHLTMAPALTAVKGYGASEVEPVYARAQLLCEEIGDENQLFRMLIGSWNFYWVRGDLETGRAIATQLLELADRADDPVRKLRAHAAMGEILFHAGELEASNAHLQKAIEFYTKGPKSSRAAQISEVACLSYAAWTQWHLGDAPGSIERAEQALALAESISHPMSLALCLSLKAELHQYRLEIHECLDAAEQAVAVSREQELPFWKGTSMIILGWAQAMNGSSADGTRNLEDGLEVFAETGARIQRTTWLGMFAEVHNREGRTVEGMRCVKEGLTWLRQTRERHYHSELLRLEGHLLMNREGMCAAEKVEYAFRSAIDVARNQRAKIREIRAVSSLSQLLLDQNRDDEALVLMQPHQSYLQSAFAGSDVTAARALLDALG